MKIIGELRVMLKLIDDVRNNTGNVLTGNFGITLCVDEERIDELMQVADKMRDETRSAEIIMR